jgi:predicted GH43/DUF377 family glycosyl hydrolase
MKIIALIRIQCGVSVLVAIFFLHYTIHTQEVIDLEKGAQDFVLETKQIIVPGFPGAFNACITRWRGSLLMSFRVRGAQMVSTFQMGFVWLDDDFNVVSTPQILEIRNDTSSYAQCQDPRLIGINESLYIMYSNFIALEDITPRRMFMAPVQYEHNSFFISRPVCIHSFEGASKRWEKNWVPFVYNGNLLLAYSLVPHTIFKPLLDTGECETVYSTASASNWKWGELRGGTPAVQDGDIYVAFFHTSNYIASTYSNGKRMQHYYMGAYTFSAQPPFRINRISPEPIIGEHFYSGTVYNTWKPLRVVFPMGCIMDKDFFWVSYGRQDHEIWVAKIDKQGLYSSLIATEPRSIHVSCRYDNYESMRA